MIFLFEQPAREQESLGPRSINYYHVRPRLERDMGFAPTETPHYLSLQSLVDR